MQSIDDSDGLRHLVRQALIEMLANSRTPGGTDAVTGAPRSRPPERGIQVTLHGSERSIRLLEEALENGDATLEVAVDSKWGPKVRVRAGRV